MARKQEDRFECELEGTDLARYGPLSWMVRPCDWYLEEYRDCKSIRGRVHQYFINGAVADCQQWRDDYYDCTQFRKTKDAMLINRIVKRELERKDSRMAATKANDVWEYRTEPPADWNRPLV